MEERRDVVERTDGLVAQMISEAVLAGSYWAAIRQDRGLTPGFTKLGNKHRRRVKALADEIAGAAEQAALRP